MYRTSWTTLKDRF